MAPCGYIHYRSFHKAYIFVMRSTHSTLSINKHYICPKVLREGITHHHSTPYLPPPHQPSPLHSTFNHAWVEQCSNTLVNEYNWFNYCVYIPKEKKSKTRAKNVPKEKYQRKKEGLIICLITYRPMPKIKILKLILIFINIVSFSVLFLSCQGHIHESFTYKLFFH